MKRGHRSNGARTDVEAGSTRSNRDGILHAAVRVTIRDGIMAMTLDAVAAEAGVSKGGLLYHFRSKDELIAAMLDLFCREMQGRLERQVAADLNPRGRFIRAMVRVMFPGQGEGRDEGALPSEPSRFFLSILTAAVNNPSLLDPVRSSARDSREQLMGSGPNGLRQIALRAALDGLMLWEHLGLLAPDDPMRQPILNELLTLAEGPDPSVSKE